MNRRQLIIALGTSGGALALPALAQAPSKIPHVGYLSTGSAESNAAFLDALRDGLRELGYVDGRNIAIDVRWAGNNAGGFPQLAASLVKEKPSAIIGTCIPSTRAAMNATHSIPVVMSVDGDPVAAGLVASLGRPGGNVTGTSTLFEALIPKWLELLSSAVPRVREMAILSYPGNVADPYFAARFDEAGKRIGIDVMRIEVAHAEDIDRAFADVVKHGAGGLVVMTEAFFAGQYLRFIPLQDKYRLPAIYGYSEFADAGGLMSYGLSFREYYRRVARYVALVLKGTRPADLPVEQPTRIELVINLATARRMGIAIPPQLLVRADRVIE